MMMRRSPLLRVAAIGGVAYMGSKAGANKASQQQAAAAQQAAPAPAAAPQPQTESTDDKFAQLKELAGLHDSGVLTDEEFAAEKAKILG